MKSEAVLAISYAIYEIVSKSFLERWIRSCPLKRSCSLNNKSLNQLVGACQQGLHGLSSKKDATDRDQSSQRVEADINQILNRCSAADLEPREAAGIAFNADQIAIRRALLTFGRVTTCRGSVSSDQSMPADIEKYGDEEPALISKSLNNHKVFDLNERKPYPLKSSERNSLTGPLTDFNDFGMSVKQICEQKNDGEHLVKNWLRQIKGQVESEPNIVEGFEIIRGGNQPIKNSIVSDSSIEVLSKPNGGSSITCDDSAFNVYFDKISNSPQQQWLSNDKVKENLFSGEMQARLYDDLPANMVKTQQTRGCLSTDDINLEKSEQPFRSVFKSVLDSENEQWLLKSGDDITNFSVTQNEMDVVVELVDNPWLVKKPESTGDEGPVNLMPDHQLDTVLGWQKVLEKVHSGGDERWLKREL